MIANFWLALMVQQLAKTSQVNLLLLKRDKTKASKHFQQLLDIAI
jgi:hypothetical protein